MERQRQRRETPEHLRRRQLGSPTPLMTNRRPRRPPQPSDELRICFVVILLGD